VDACSDKLNPPSVFSEQEGYSVMRTRHQKGCLKQVMRKGGSRVWIFRWREIESDGSRRARKIVVGSMRDLRNESAAREALDRLSLNINLDLSEGARPPASFSELIEHYRRKELAGDNERKSYSTKQCYNDYLTNWIAPRWGAYTLTRIENGIAVFVEEWLATIQRSRGTKAKIRNIMSAVCSHAIRYGWMKTNPIRAVRQSAKRERIPTPLTSGELQALFAELGLRHRTLVLLDVRTAQHMFNHGAGDRNTIMPSRSGSTSGQFRSLALMATRHWLI
jgi:hypothetical protein